MTYSRLSFNKIIGKSEDVNTDVLRKICTALNCTLNNIVEITPDKPDNLGGETR